MSEQPPVKVSPLIKFSRWSLLVLGFFYGAANRKRFAKKEEKVREIEAQQKVIRDAQLAEERIRRQENERRGMELLFGSSSSSSSSGDGSAPSH